MPLSPGVRLGPYEIVDTLGAGGMGEVYRARDRRLERLVALKVLPAGAALSPESVARFEREARAASALNHPHICTIYDIGSDPPFIAMELLEGETLESRLRRGPLAVAGTIEIALAVSDALGAAHQKGIIHRDIKPANIFLTARGPKVLDFGVATTMRVHTEEATRPGTLQLTAPGTAVGTVGYMSPEQVQALPLDARSDLFSLGVVIYEMATGTRPFTGANQALVYDAILNRVHVPPSRLNASIPRDLERVIAKALQKDRALRYQDAAALHADLQRLTPARVVNAPRAPMQRRSVLAGIAAAVAVVVIALIYWYAAPSQATRLTDKDTIVLAEFVNTTGDPVFDGTLRQGLAVQLRQSPFLSVISETRIQQTLRFMGLPPDARLTADIARQLCERTSSAALLEGSIASLGSHYVLGLRATHCVSGELLDEQQAQAARKEDVLTVLGEIASTFRRRVGESLATVQALATPLPEATTSSLEALKAMDAALKTLYTSGTAAAIPLFRRAVEIDPNFAMAHAQLGLAYTAGSKEAVESTTRAYELRHRTSEHERFFITAIYDRQVTGNLAKALDTLRLWRQTYPRDPLAHTIGSGFSAQGLGKYEESIAAATRAIELDPDTPFAYASIGFVYVYLDRFDEAADVLARADQRKLELPDLNELRYHLAFIKGDASGMARVVSAASGRGPIEMRLLHLQALVEARAGRVREARTLWDRAGRLAVEARLADAAALCEAAAAVAAALYGDPAAAKRGAAAALQRSRGRDATYGAALAFALAGEISSSEPLAAELAERFPEDTSVQHSYLPVLQALAALQRRQPAEAIERLRVAEGYETAVPAIAFNWFFGAMYPSYVRGLAYAQLDQSVPASAEFERILTHRGLMLGDPLGPVVQWQLARTLAAAGQRERAETAYRELLAVWRDADADFPLLQNARSELAR